MKKHRNFLIFYSLWLGGIFLLFMAFDKDQKKDQALKNQGDTICKLSTKSEPYGESSKCSKSTLYKPLESNSSL